MYKRIILDLNLTTSMIKYTVIYIVRVFQEWFLKMSPPKRKIEIVDAKTDKKELNKESEDEALGDLDLDRWIE